MNAKTEINTIYGNKIRVRACGILIKDNAALLIKHNGIGEKGYLWAPPGGGVDFGDTIEDTIKREFLEECNISVSVKHLMYIKEYIEHPLHAIELFYKIECADLSTLKIGFDPELKNNILAELSFLTKIQLQNENNKALHSVIQELINNKDLV